MLLISLNVCLMVVSGSLKCVSRSFIEGACIVPLAPAAMTMSGSTFHHNGYLKVVGISGFVFNCFLWEPTIAVCEFNKLNCKVV